MNLSFPETPMEVPLSQNALVVLKKRYLKKDDEGNLDEGVGDMFLRVAEPSPRWICFMIPRRM
jgi:hypothetical protein